MAIGRNDCQIAGTQSSLLKLILSPLKDCPEQFSRSAPITSCICQQVGTLAILGWCDSACPRTSFSKLPPVVHKRTVQPGLLLNYVNKTLQLPN